MIEKIISGGQTGVDQGALDAALDIKVDCGGWCPKGRKSEMGIIQAKYPLVEDSSSAYPSRTRKNILDSDGTLIISSSSILIGGSKLTKRIAQEIGKPIYVTNIDFIISDVHRVCADVANWIMQNSIKVLNVAGSRESNRPGIQKTVRDFVIQLYFVSSPETRVIRYHCSNEKCGIPWFGLKENQEKCSICGAYGVSTAG